MVPSKRQHYTRISIIFFFLGFIYYMILPRLEILMICFLVAALFGLFAIFAQGDHIRHEREIRHFSNPLNQRIEKLEAELEDLKRQARDNPDHK